MEKIAILIASATLAFIQPVLAADGASSGSKNVLSVGLKGGVAFPQINSSLETTFFYQLEASYMMPFWGSRFGVVTTLGYTEPTASGTATDPRLPDEEYTWKAIQRQVVWDLGLILKLNPADSDWNIGGILGSRLIFLSTLTNGTADGQPFGEHDEQATVSGAYLAFQGEYSLGPGALVGELSYWASFQEMRTSGVFTVSEVILLLGYRFVFEF